MGEASQSEDNVVEMEELLGPPWLEISDGSAIPFEEGGRNRWLGQRVGLWGLQGFLFHHVLGVVIIVRVSAPPSPCTHQCRTCPGLAEPHFYPCAPPITTAQCSKNRRALKKGRVPGEPGLARMCVGEVICLGAGSSLPAPASPSGVPVCSPLQPPAFP